MKTNRTCMFCGTPYYYCPNCNDKRDPKIFTTYDSEECMKAFKTLIKYNKKEISVQEASATIKALHVEPDNIVKESRREMVRELINYSPIVKNVELLEEANIEETSVSETEVKISEPLLEMESSLEPVNEQPKMNYKPYKRKKK